MTVFNRLLLTFVKEHGDEVEPFSRTPCCAAVHGSLWFFFFFWFSVHVFTSYQANLRFISNNPHVIVERQTGSVLFSFNEVCVMLT